MDNIKFVNEIVSKDLYPYAVFYKIMRKIRYMVN